VNLDRLKTYGFASKKGFLGVQKEEKVAEFFGVQKEEKVGELGMQTAAVLGMLALC
jgi:hypothetical protein